MPLGRRTLPLAMVWRTSSSDTPYCSSCCGCSSTRTAGSELPPTWISPTPDTCDSFCAITVEARSYSWLLSSCGEVSDSTMIGACDGLNFS